MKKNQFASLHAGMLMRASRPATKKMAVPAANDAEEQAAAAIGAGVAATAAEAPAVETASNTAPIWRDDKPLSYATWEQLRAELLPPGWGRPSSATAVAAELPLLDEQEAGDDVVASASASPAAEIRHDDGLRTSEEVARGDTDLLRQRHRGGFGRRATPPPSGDDHVGDEHAGDTEFAEAEAHSPLTDGDFAEAEAQSLLDAELLDIPRPGGIRDAAVETDPVDLAIADGEGAVEIEHLSEPFVFDESGEFEVETIDAEAPAAEIADLAETIAASEAAGADDTTWTTGAVMATAVDDLPLAEPVDADYDDADENDAASDLPVAASGRRKAMTVRLDAARHRRLKLAGVYYGRSCQDLMVGALDAYLAQLGFNADQK